MTDELIWDIIPFTEQRYRHLLEIEAGTIWWDPKWQAYRKTGTPRGSMTNRPSFDFIQRFGLAYQTQKINFSGWFQCGLTTDGQILLAHWKEQKKEGLKNEFRKLVDADETSSPREDGS